MPLPLTLIPSRRARWGASHAAAQNEGQLSAPLPLWRPSEALLCEAPKEPPALAAGSLAAVDRGTCPFATKVENARKAGAAAVLILDTLKAEYANNTLQVTEPCALDCAKGQSYVQVRGAGSGRVTSPHRASPPPGCPAPRSY